MSATLQIGKVVLFREPQPAGPQLQVEWSSRWQEFLSSVKPALSRSSARLAGEAPFGLIPLRIMLPSYFLEAFAIFAFIAIQVKVAELRPQVVPRISTHDVIYYSGDELPRTEDLGGAETGKTGRAGGDEAFHRTQTIKIARGASLVPKIVDAPNLRLPSSNDAVANLLAVHPNPGPPPANGLQSARSSMSLATTIVAPPPNAIRDYTRNGVQLDSVIAPAPSVTRERSMTAPTLSPQLIAPAPNVSNDHALVAPLLAPAVIPPAPKVSGDRRLTAPSLNAQIVAPAPNVSREQGRAAPALAGTVIPPAPGAVQRDPFSSPIQMTSAAVVPPPVAAPERATSRNSKLALPAPSVVAPPPSAELSHDVRRVAAGSPDAAQAVVPPPPAQPSGSIMSSLIGRIFGASEVVPPPPAVNANREGSKTPSLQTSVVPPPPSAMGKAANTAAPSLTANVVPPPPSVNANGTGGNSRGTRGGSGATLGSNVVAPPPSVGAAAGTGASARWTASTMGSPNVVPPPPSLSGPGGGTGSTPGGKGVGDTLLASNVVPPPPSVGDGSAQTGSGIGRKGAGLGAPTDVGQNLVPAKTGGSGANAGAVMSTQPGPKVGIPTTGGTGSLAMSPSGGDKTGLGGSGGGTSIARGNGTGSGMMGAGAGAGKSGAAHGADPTARGGISTSSGPGGAGNVAAGNPPVRGVDISGGSGIITLPSFGSDGSASDPASARRSSTGQTQTLNVEIVTTASSGGAFEPYKNLLHGEKHTIYPETSSSLGAASMEYADESGKLTGIPLVQPQPIRTTLPEGLPHARMVVTCVLDAAGNFKNFRVIEPGPAGMTAKVLAALRSWKFKPAMRGEQPVELNVVLGFMIDTNDRF